MVAAVRDLRSLLEQARERGDTVGFVPTMGALHAGHRSLIERAVSECDVVAVSIFVNPLQFGQSSDIEHYPRTLDADLQLCEEAGAAFVFAPLVTEMYPTWPDPPATTVTVGALSTTLEGASRPGHFDGVSTVVAKLFAMAGPCRAYFGQKDYQQLAVLSAMVRDLCLPIELVPCATVREPDGLALSSRNVRLSVDERKAAVVLSRALMVGRSAVVAGANDPSHIRALMAACVRSEALVDLDYAVVVDRHTLVEPATLAGLHPNQLRLLVAAVVGPVRLIDNCDVVSGVGPVTEVDGLAVPRDLDDVNHVIEPPAQRQFERIG
jgi:pantoate--beta-alanine ligase